MAIKSKIARRRIGVERLRGSNPGIAILLMGSQLALPSGQAWTQPGPRLEL